MLITIACVAVAVVALLLAFLLSRGDGSKKVEPVKNVAPAVAPAKEPETIAPMPAAAAQERSEQKTQQLPQQSPEGSRSQPTQVTRQVSQLDFDESPKYTIPVPEYHENSTDVNHFRSDSTALSQSAPVSLEEPAAGEDITVLSRKLYELAGQMHFLQRRSREVEQNLAQLSDVLEQLQQQQVRQNRQSQPAQNSQPEVEYAGSHAHPYGEKNF